MVSHRLLTFLLYRYGQFLCPYSSLCFIFSVQIVIIMAMWPLHARIFILITIAMTAPSTHHLAPQVVYQTLEHALITDSKVVYLMQNTFVPSQGSSRDIVIIGVNVTADSLLPGSCDEYPPLPNMPVTFPYYQKFQWSSSPLFNLISVDQLLIIDNVISGSIHHNMEHPDKLHVSLHIDTLPCNVSEDDLLEALMQLLPWVSTSLHACMNIA